MHQIINLALIAVIGLCIFETFHRNLFQCALFLGRTGFAFLLAMALFEPASRRVVTMIEFPAPYARGLVFFLIWILVLWGFEPLAYEILKDSGRNMKFKHERPGRLLTGLLSGLLVSGALSVNLVMLPAVEGLYFQNDAKSTAGLHRAAGGVYRILTLTPKDTVAIVQLEAGRHWARERINADKRGAERLIKTFDERYRRENEPSDVRQHREQILTELRWLVGETGGNKT